MSIVIPLKLVNVHEMVCSGTARASHTKVALDPLLMTNWSKGGLAITGTPAKGKSHLQNNTRKYYSDKKIVHNIISIQN